MSATPALRNALTAALMLLLAACAREEAPEGRWEGFSQSANWIVAARLQIDKGNVMHATALSIEVAGTSLPERLNLADKMKRMLPEEWENAPEGKIDFKNNVIRRAGGVAPLFIYDPKQKTMMFKFYAGGKLTESIKLHPVKNFMVAG